VSETHAGTAVPAARLKSLAALVSQQADPGAIPPEEWHILIPAALEQRVGPLLYWAARRSGIDTTPDAWATLRESHRGAAAYHVILEHAQRQAQAALAKACIPTLWLKGIALARMVYPEPYLRLMDDLDLLVPYDRREEALEQMIALGYHTYSDPGQLLGPEDEFAQRSSHHYHLRGGPADAAILELHYRLLGKDASLLPPEQMAWFWQQTQPISPGAGSMTLNPEAHLLYLCAHALLQHSEADNDLRRYLDLHLLVTRTPLRWPLVVEQAAQLRWTYPVQRALQLTAALFATPIPAEVLASLSRHPDDEDLLRVDRLRSKGLRWEQAMIHLSSLSLADRTRLILRIAFPAPDYMRHRYDIPAGRAVWPYYPARWLDQGREMCRAAAGRLEQRLRKHRER
jgi:hypothetical protein